MKKILRIIRLAVRLALAAFMLCFLPAAWLIGIAMAKSEDTCIKEANDFVKDIWKEMILGKDA